MESYTIITTEPNASLAELHNRVPVILDPADYDQWLDPAADGAALLKPCPDEWLTAMTVSTHVNSVKHDDPRRLEPELGPADDTLCP